MEKRENAIHQSADDKKWASLMVEFVIDRAEIFVEKGEKAIYQSDFFCKEKSIMLY